MRVVIVGAGNVASHLAKKLYKSGACIVQIMSPSESADILANQVNATAVHDCDALDRTADYYLIAVKDDAIANIAKCLNGVSGIVMHTSGSVDICVFSDTDIAHYGVLYPLQTFSKNREVNFLEIPFFIEANSAETLKQIDIFAHVFSDKVSEVSSSSRRALHLSAVFACNFVNHMYAVAENLLQEHSIPFDVLQPLIQETARKIIELSPRSAQTGPAVRYDNSILEKHMAMIPDNRTREIYKLISENIHSFAQEK